MGKNEMVVERVFSQVELDSLEAHKKAIADLGTQAEGIACSLAYHLWDISTKKLYEIESKPDGTAFKGIGDYAEYTFGIAKGTTSDSVNTFERFGNRETQGIADKYKDYKFSNLMVLKKLTDEQIEIANIRPTDSKATIKDKLKAFQIAQNKLAMLPDKRTQAYEAHESLSNAAYTIAAMIRSQGDDKDLEIEAILQDFNKEYLEVFGDNKASKDMDYDECDRLINMVKRYKERIREVDGGSPIESDDTPDNAPLETPDDTPDNAPLETPDDMDSEAKRIFVSRKALTKALKVLYKEMGWNQATTPMDDIIVIEVTE